jgi:hypothetical protein
MIEIDLLCRVYFVTFPNSSIPDFMSIFIIVLGALIVIVLYSKEIDSKKREDSQLGFYTLLSMIIIVILLFVADMLSK